MADGTYQPVVLNDFSGGWVSNLDRESDSLALNQSPDLENVDFDGGGSFMSRRGFKLFGNRISTAGSIPSVYTFRRPITGDEIVVRQNNPDGGTNFLEYYNTSTAQFETLKVTLTNGYVMNFKAYTASLDTSDYLYFCDGNINLTRWTGGNTKLNGALAGGEATITVVSTTGFPASGSIVIGTTTVTYAAKTPTTFTTCVGTPAALNGAAVTDLPVDFAASSGTKPKGNILTVFRSQLFVANNQWITASDVDDFTKWNIITGSLAFKKGFAGGRITAMDSKADHLIVHTENSIQEVSYTFTGDLTGFQMNIADLEVAAGYGAKYWKALCRTEGQLYYGGADCVIRTLTRSRAMSATSGNYLDAQSISDNIKFKLAYYDLSKCSAISWKNKLYFAVTSNESSINDTVLVYDLKYSSAQTLGQQEAPKEAWTKYRMYVSDFFVYGGQLYFSSSASPNCFKLFTDENNNDLLTDDGAAISWYYYTPQIDFGKPELVTRLNKVVSKGFITANQSADYDFNFTYGMEAAQTVTINGTDETVLTPAIPALGEEIVGEDGATVVDAGNSMSPFIYPFDVGTYDSHNTQVKISGTSKGDRYKQTRLILYVELQADEMTN